MKALPTMAALFVLVLLPASLSSGKASAQTSEIPTITFCEMVKNPRLYFDKPVRLTATLQMATEASYLKDDACPLSHDDQIGLRYFNSDEKEQQRLREDVHKIRTIEYGSRAKVTVVGALRNSSRRDFAWYRYRFDISRFEDISHVIIPYEGSLQAGITYRAKVRGDGDAGLAFILPLRMQPHYAVRIEWINLDSFPALKQPGNNAGERQIVFSVVSDEIKHVDVQRWNRTIECKIISVD